MVNACDSARLKNGRPRCVAFWENAKGVLADKTNAFGCMVPSLAGLYEPLKRTKWPMAGIVRGPVRDAVWRVLDAKCFGVPQQRRRLYLMAGSPESHLDSVLFEPHTRDPEKFPTHPLLFNKDGVAFEVFREYTDCLYSSYGTKWNGNAAAYNGSLYVVQDGRIRRLTPLECERLMGFPDNYTNLPGARRTSRYQAVGNSWAVQVVRWLGRRKVENVQSFRLVAEPSVYCQLAAGVPTFCSTGQ